jgi:hypothetical protein
VLLPAQHPRTQQYARPQVGQISLEEILRADTPAQKLVEGEELQEIIK